MRELVIGKLKELGYDSAAFGLHSYRAGGATAAAAAQVPDHLLRGMDDGGRKMLKTVM